MKTSQISVKINVFPFFKKNKKNRLIFLFEGYIFYFYLRDSILKLPYKGIRILIELISNTTKS